MGNSAGRRKIIRLRFKAHILKTEVLISCYELLSMSTVSFTCRALETDIVDAKHNNLHIDWLVGRELKFIRDKFWKQLSMKRRIVQRKFFFDRRKSPHILSILVRFASSCYIYLALYRGHDYWECHRLHHICELEPNRCDLAAPWQISVTFLSKLTSIFLKIVIHFDMNTLQSLIVYSKFWR